MPVTRGPEIVQSLAIAMDPMLVAVPGGKWPANLQHDGTGVT